MKCLMEEQWLSFCKSTGWIDGAPFPVPAQMRWAFYSGAKNLLLTLEEAGFEFAAPGGIPTKDEYDELKEILDQLIRRMTKQVTPKPTLSNAPKIILKEIHDAGAIAFGFAVGAGIAAIGARTAPVEDVLGMMDGIRAELFEATATVPPGIQVKDMPERHPRQCAPRGAKGTRRA